MFYCKSYGINFGALVESGRVLWEFGDTNYAGAQMTPRDFSGPYQPKLSRIISQLGQSN